MPKEKEKPNFWVYANPYARYYPFGTEMVYDRGGLFNTALDFRCNQLVEKRFPHLAVLESHELEHRITDCLADAMVYVERVHPEMFRKHWQRSAAFDMAHTWFSHKHSGKRLNRYELLCAYIIAIDTFENFC